MRNISRATGLLGLLLEVVGEELFEAGEGLFYGVLPAEQGCPGFGEFGEAVFDEAYAGGVSGVRGHAHRKAELFLGCFHDTAHKQGGTGHDYAPWESRIKA